MTNRILLMIARLFIAMYGEKSIETFKVEIAELEKLCD